MGDVVSTPPPLTSRTQDQQTPIKYPQNAFSPQQQPQRTMGDVVSTPPPLASRPQAHQTPIKSPQNAFSPQQQPQRMQSPMQQPQRMQSPMQQQQQLQRWHQSQQMFQQSRRPLHGQQDISEGDECTNLGPIIMREAKDVNSKELTILNANTRMRVIAVDGRRACVATPDGRTGWVSLRAESGEILVVKANTQLLAPPPFQRYAQPGGSPIPLGVLGALVAGNALGPATRTSVVPPRVVAKPLNLGGVQRQVSPVQLQPRVRSQSPVVVRAVQEPEQWPYQVAVGRNTLRMFTPPPLARSRSGPTLIASPAPLASPLASPLATPLATPSPLASPKISGPAPQVVQQQPWRRQLPVASAASPQGPDSSGTSQAQLATTSNVGESQPHVMHKLAPEVGTSGIPATTLPVGYQSAAPVQQATGVGWSMPYLASQPGLPGSGITNMTASSVISAGSAGTLPPFKSDRIDLYSTAVQLMKERGDKQMVDQLQARPGAPPPAGEVGGFRRGFACDY